MNLRDLFNSGTWNTRTIDTWQLTVSHRGAPGGVREVTGSAIDRVESVGLRLRPDAQESDGAFIPYHRIQFVRGRHGQTLWQAGEPVREDALATEAGGDPSESPPSLSGVAPTADLPSGHHRTAGFGVTLDSGDVLTLDGSAGEGGGQILRTSLTLSILTGRPFVLERIRAGRSKPGLMRQHLACVRAAAAICNANVVGARPRSDRLEFYPSTVQAGEFELAVGSAGSTGLVLQTVALPLAVQQCESHVSVTGGTYGAWAPATPFLTASWVPRVREMGYPVQIVEDRAGFYPAGGGRLFATLGGTPPGPSAALELTTPPAVANRSIDAYAIVAGLSEGIARRELSAVAEALGEPHSLRLHSRTVHSAGPGNAVWLEVGDRTLPADSPKSVFVAIGKKSVHSEDVAGEAADAFLHWASSEVAVCPHLADQLLLPMAYAEGGRFTTSEPTMHTWTQIEVIAAFTGIRIEVVELAGGRFVVEVPAPA